MTAKAGAPASRQRAPFKPQLPTDNAALLTGNESAFYQFVDRTENGAVIQMWEAGQYGFVRNRKVGSDGKVVYTRFHEGIDIAPAKRDAAGEPLDEVRAMADGTVVHINSTPGLSNYGNFIVVRHDTEAGPFFSLYAHLKKVSASPGQSVAQGTVLGLLGYTGVGLDRRRAHVHVEINLLLSEHFDPWHAAAFNTPNHHGIYNGLNLTGIDPAAFIKGQKADPSLTLIKFVRSIPAYYRVRAPSHGKELEIVRRYPWLRQAGALSESWEVTFSASGFPLSVSPSAARSGFPSAVACKNFSGPHAWNTRSLLAGNGASAMLTPEGVRYANLVLGDFPLEIKKAVPEPALPVDPAKAAQKTQPKATPKVAPKTVPKAMPKAPVKTPPKALPKKVTPKSVK